MMKRTLTTIIWSLAALTAVAQTTVVFPLKQMTGTAHRRELTVTSLDGVRKVGTNLVYPVPMTVTAQGGQFRTNLFTGNYRLTMQGVPGYSDAFVPDTNVVVYWNDLVPATPSALTLSQYYTKAQIDALLAGAGSVAGAITNHHSEPVYLDNALTVSNGTMTVNGALRVGSAEFSEAGGTVLIGASRMTGLSTKLLVSQAAAPQIVSSPWVHLNPWPAPADIGLASVWLYNSNGVLYAVHVGSGVFTKTNLLSAP